MNAFSKNGSAQLPQLLMSLQRVRDVLSHTPCVRGAQKTSRLTQCFWCARRPQSYRWAPGSDWEGGVLPHNTMLSLAGTAQGHSVPLLTSKFINRSSALTCRVTGSQGHLCTQRYSRSVHLLCSQACRLEARADHTAHPPWWQDHAFVASFGCPVDPGPCQGREEKGNCWGCYGTYDRVDDLHTV